jgi:hypothetical protein
MAGKDLIGLVFSDNSRRSVEDGELDIYDTVLLWKGRIIWLSGLSRLGIASPFSLVFHREETDRGYTGRTSGIKCCTILIVFSTSCYSIISNLRPVM